MTEQEQAIEEFKTLREEILQLNGEACATLIGGLTLNFAILGTAFSSSRGPTELAPLPTLVRDPVNYET